MRIKTRQVTQEWVEFDVGEKVRFQGGSCEGEVFTVSKFIAPFEGEWFGCVFLEGQKYGYSADRITSVKEGENVPD